MTTPTLLTLLRIGLIPVMVIVFFLPYTWSGIAAALVFSLGAITDWLDGYLARRLGQTSAFGAFLDPVADKLMVAVALVLIVKDMPTVWTAVPAAVIIGREITVSALREWMAELGKSATVAVNMLGKIKTTCQITALIMLLFKYPLFSLPIIAIGHVMLYLAAALTLWSMVLYMKKAWPVLRF
ncbi:MAG: CDP-diacylglycerol--glycerol-3-phosphate 3-phosphatidyltransferase [Gammaproteobacteria bacterium]|nr:CDP-diacylglycerol--glycerol-3-phosphate 3-phosphatidyltransferase [Gammaproteobacteria bacterium]